MMKRHNTRSQVKNHEQDHDDTFTSSEPLNNDDAELSENRPKKKKNGQSIQESITESEDELSSRVSYDTASPYFAPTHFSPQHEFQEQPEFQEQLEFTNNSRQSEDIEQITLDRFLKAPDVKILTNNVVDSKLSNGSWVWKYMRKDKLKNQIKCDVITNLDGYEKKCPKVFSFKTSTTHLGEHLNAVHRLFSQQQIEKNSEIIESDKSIQTIPSIFAKLDSHKPAKQQKLLFLLTAWVVEDCQALTVVEGQRFRELCHEMDPRFKVPGSALVKTKIRESVLFAEDQLRELVSKTMESFSFTTDMWTSMHRPYIGITIHWLSKNFELYQAVLTIEEFPYSHSGERQEQFLSKIFEHWNIRDKLIGGTTDNDKSVVKGMRLLETPHIRCTAHTIQLAIKDGLSACDNILSKAKKLNNWLVKRDRYRQSLRNIQNEFNQLSTNISEDSEWPLLEDEDSDSEPEDLYESLAQSSRQVKKKEQSIVEPIRDIKTRWNSTFFVLKRLLQLRDAVEQLAKSLNRHPEYQQKKDGQNLSGRLLSEEEWNELEDLLKLLSPFAQSTKLIGGAQYPTLGMMLPTISLLLSHIRQMKTSLSSSSILNVCQRIENSMLARWESPPIEAYFASYLDPRFKNLSFASNEKKKKVQDMLLEIIEARANAIDTPVQTEMDQLYDGVQLDFPIENEIERYNKVTQMNKYCIDDPFYKTHNPLIWWRTNEKEYPNLAALARKFLAFPATSVPSERLFSDAGNILTKKRNRLDPTTVHDILFLKTNSKIFNVYPGLK